MKFKPWTLMFGGALACATLSLLLVYIITVTKNVNYEVFIYVLVFLGFGFAAAGYFIESKYKKEHPEKYEFEMPEDE